MHTTRITQEIHPTPVAATMPFAGYASVFGLRDNNGHVIAHGAFATTSSYTVKMLWQHNQSQPIGGISDLHEDDIGLYVAGYFVLKAQQGLEAYELVRCGALNGLSVGFRVIDSQYDSQRDTHYVNEAILYEISVVTIPANPRAVIMSVG